MTGMPMSGAERSLSLLTRAASGDEIAFAQLVEAYHADMRRVSYVVCADADLVDEAVQQAWQIAWRKLGTVRHPDRVRAWLVSVAANETRQLMRRGRRRPEVELKPAWAADFDTDPGADVRLIDLAVALRRLSAEDRALLAMRYVTGLNATEISAVAGGSPSGVRSRLARLLRRMREELNDV
jgi:RNA polymerase sigma-70 factor (ECF subfamily)